MAHDSDWQTVFKLADQGICVKDVAEVVAISNGGPGSWPWCGVFRLQDGRGAFAWATCSRAGWGDPRPLASRAFVRVEPSPHEVFIKHVTGDSRIALYGQFQFWHAGWIAGRVLAFVGGDRSGWADYRQDVAGCSSDILYALPGEVAFARAEKHYVKYVHYFTVGRYDDRWSGGLTEVAALTELGPSDERPICGRRLSEPRETYPKRPAPSSGGKCCDTCGAEVRLADLTGEERRDDFWRCPACWGKIRDWCRGAEEVEAARAALLAKLAPEDHKILLELSDSEGFLREKS
jgi:hypothetical protein